VTISEPVRSGRTLTGKQVDGFEFGVAHFSDHEQEVAGQAGQFVLEVSKRSSAHCDYRRSWPPENAASYFLALYSEV